MSPSGRELEPDPSYDVTSHEPRVILGPPPTGIRPEGDQGAPRPTPPFDWRAPVPSEVSDALYMTRGGSPNDRITAALAAVGQYVHPTLRQGAYAAALDALRGL